MGDVIKTPNPGSPEAVAAGCLCPVLDNHHGKGVPHKGVPQFWQDERCPLHGTAAKEASDAK